MEELIQKLKAAEDALETYRANARLSKIYDTEAEGRLIDSVEHARLQIQNYEQRRTAFYEKRKSEYEILKNKQIHEREVFVEHWDALQQELGYDY